MPRVLSFDPGFRNLSYCMIDFDGSVPEIMRWATECITEVHKPTTAQVIEAAAAWVHKNPWVYLEPDIVVFEQQPRTNQKMQKLVTCLHGAILTQARTAGNGHLVCTYVRPLAKFAVFAQPSGLQDLARQATNSQRYRWRKQFAAALTQELLTQWGDKENMDLFTECKSNFDMADSFTNCCALAHTRKIFCFTRSSGSAWTDPDSKNEQVKQVRGDPEAKGNDIPEH